jgi:hypothetical protein
MSVYRPGGITVIAVFYIIFAVLGVFAIIVIEGVLVPMYQSTVSQNYVLDLLMFAVYPFPPIPIEFLLSFILVSYFSAMSSLSFLVYFHVGVLVILTASVLYFISSVGLLIMKKWGYYLALILAILNIVCGIFTLVNLIIGIVLTVYLAGDVKYEFE